MAGLISPFLEVTGGKQVGGLLVSPPRQASTFRRQKLDPIYPKFKSQFNELFLIVQKQQEGDQNLLKLSCGWKMYVVRLLGSKGYWNLWKTLLFQIHPQITFPTLLFHTSYFCLNTRYGRIFICIKLFSCIYYLFLHICGQNENHQQYINVWLIYQCNTSMPFNWICIFLNEMPNK